MSETERDTTKFSDMAEDQPVEGLSQDEAARREPDAGEMILLDSADDLPAYRPEAQAPPPSAPPGDEDAGLTFSDSAPTARRAPKGDGPPRPSRRLPPVGRGTPARGTRAPSRRTRRPGPSGRNRPPSESSRTPRGGTQVGSGRQRVRGPTPGRGVPRPSTPGRGQPRPTSSQGSGRHPKAGAKASKRFRKGSEASHGTSSTSQVGRTRPERPERTEAESQAALELLQERAEAAGAKDPFLGRDLGPFKVEIPLSMERGERRYLATHEETKEWALLRVFPLTGSYKDEFSRVASRGERAARVDHPGVDLALGVGKTKECFYVGTRPPLGPTLAETIKSGQRFSEQQVVDLLEQLGGALKALHAREMFHGHLGLETIREERPGYYVLHEVGLARPRAAYSFLSAGGDVLGWPGFIAPETVDSGGSSREADVYALGCVAWNLVAGRSPFEADDEVQLLLDQLNREVPRLDAVGVEVAPELATLISKATGYTSDVRYKDSTELLSDLRGLKQKETVRPFASETKAEPESAASLRGTGNTVMIVLVLLNAAIVGLLALVWFQAKNVTFSDPVVEFEFPLEPPGE